LNEASRSAGVFRDSCPSLSLSLSLSLSRSRSSAS